MTKGNMLVGK